MIAMCSRCQLRVPRALALAPLAAAALAASGCGVASSQEAVSFVNARRGPAARARVAIDQAQALFASLPGDPSRSQLQALLAAAEAARVSVNRARAGLPTYQTAEEELPIAESELGVGANELNYAMRELASYAGYPRADALALYRRYLRSGREQWNSAVIELWRLAREPGPPLLRSG